MAEAAEKSVRDKVQELLDTGINPAVAGHGGYIELIDVKDSTVYIRLSGGCQGCGAADVTLKAGIERMIFEEIPEVTEVLDTTDHATGTNPYYAPSKA
jgi:Fe/S biogenesis protein NfuA